MHIYCMDSYRHDHVQRAGSGVVERRIRWVMALTLVTMVVEIAAGWLFGSLALLADGWHMASHGLAMFIALFALSFARKNQANPNFTFGTGKVDALGGFASAIVLGGVSLFMVWEAVQRLITPTAIAYGEAMVVAVIGLAVNLVSVLILEPPGHGHDHGHDHDHDHDHQETRHHHSHSAHATYLHILADLLTSLGAIVALGAGMYLSWNWLDPAVGMVGAVVIAIWARGLLKSTSGILLDETNDPELMEAIRQRIEADGDNRIADLHVWSMEPGRRAAIISVVTHFPKHPDHYKRLLDGMGELGHVTVEVVAHEGEPCLAAGH